VATPFADLAAGGPPDAESSAPKFVVDASPAGGEFTGLVTDKPIPPGEYEGAFAKVYELAGLNPAEYRIVDDTVRFSAWQQSKRLENGDRDTITLYAYRARFQRITQADAATEDIASLVAIARTNAKVRPPAKAGARTRVVVLSDAQVGKVGSRGGTDALLARVADLLAQLDAIMREQPCQDALVIDPGDLCEGFENVAAQRHTNDLSHPAQLRVARAILTNAVTAIAARHLGCRVVTVPSNHTAWRAGKEYLGKPSDDYGIDVHRAVSEALSRDSRFRSVTWTFPEPWDDSVAVAARGAIIGVAHGHQKSNPDQIPAWWKGQAHGSQAIAAATILVTGHFHHFRAQPSGAVDGRARYWFQAPTMDNGSDWYRNISGDDSAPGILTFTIGDDGAWDHLRVVTARA
jgi:hypothetical protein